ncbi:unnamed protein product [Protopolystoma xenopodis]|uniref:Uncharacterized protein n=1 Tax=Protopolystoma xenopodis TaxID=117903 RepID=A0A448WJI6_9PLAT|nr:unnamed protein product [Protopolystoma xenopodis]
MSWEAEENKSRHVDFQCVKSKSVNDLNILDQPGSMVGVDNSSTIGHQQQQFQQPQQQQQLLFLQQQMPQSSQPGRGYGTNSGGQHFGTTRTRRVIRSGGHHEAEEDEEEDDDEDEEEDLPRNGVDFEADRAIGFPTGLDNTHVDIERESEVMEDGEEYAGDEDEDAKNEGESGSASRWRAAKKIEASLFEPYEGDEADDASPDFDFQIQKPS